MTRPYQLGSICVLRLSAIGDVCHAIAAVQMIQRHWPEQKITWVIEKEAVDLVSDLPGIEFIVVNKEQGYFQSMKKLKSHLNGRRFEYLLHMQPTVRANIFSTCIRAKIRLGYDRIRSHEWQLFFINKRIEKPKKNHAVDSYLDFVKALGIPVSDPTWNIPFDQKSYAALLEKIPNANKPIFVIHPAASRTEKNWSPDNYAELGRHASAKGFTVILTGSQNSCENFLALEIMNKASYPITNLLGKLNLKMLHVLLSKASIVLAPDTGPLHIAVAAGTPVIGLYARTNPKRTGPYNPIPDNIVTVYEELIAEQYKKSFLKLPWRTHAKGSDIMTRINVSEVKEKFDRLTHQIVNKKFLKQ